MNTKPKRRKASAGDRRPALMMAGGKENRKGLKDRVSCAVSTLKMDDTGFSILAFRKEIDIPEISQNFEIANDTGMSASGRVQTIVQIRKEETT